jgi:hypothetical protein
MTSLSTLEIGQSATGRSTTTGMSRSVRRW